MTILINANKSSDEMKHPFMVKCLHKVETEASTLKIAIVTSIILNDENLESPVSPLLYKIVFKVLSTAIMLEKEIQGIQTGKKIKLSLLQVKFNMDKRSQRAH